ncbi:hypothetical protein ANN_19088 [Periplaneta americana]|uniref:Uncharacterized protein n=1 Tax=Periplaneta americana TaxID=6978 RepID=A0ABQ8SSN9_PERAM|nr:hypothetical protein ANN_19088 [Periplaneta americana]
MTGLCEGDIKSHNLSRRRPGLESRSGLVFFIEKSIATRVTDKIAESVTLFGIEPRVRLTTSSLPSDVIKNVYEEDELETVIGQMNAELKEREAQEEEEVEEEKEMMLASTSSNISLARKEP